MGSIPTQEDIDMLSEIRITKNCLIGSIIILFLFFFYLFIHLYIEYNII